jgi:hypothetical protein
VRAESMVDVIAGVLERLMVAWMDHLKVDLMES